MGCGAVCGLNRAVAQVFIACIATETIANCRLLNDYPSAEYALTPELSRAAHWRKLCASVALAQR